MAESKLVVYGAIAANIAIAVTKFIAAGVSGSSAMLSEAIHSTVDSGNELLLLVGLNRASQPPDAAHPFGYGKELYFWSLIVAVLIFGVGGGVTVWEGIMHVRSPQAATSPGWSYVVLGVSALFEGASFAFAVRAVWKDKGNDSFLGALHASKDPTTFTVVAEDGAALIGLAIAALGIWGSEHFQMPVLDGIASIAIGVLLAGVAVLLIRESRGLLVGEGVDREMAAGIRALALDDPQVADASLPATMYFGPENVLVALDVQFRDEVQTGEINDAVRRVEQSIRSRYPSVRRLYIEANPASAVGRDAHSGSHQEPVVNPSGMAP
jgi:cation diffusion facilitator family transporter